MLNGKLPALLRGGIHFIDIRDAIRAVWRAMELPQARPIYHLAGMNSSIEEFFGLVEEEGRAAALFPRSCCCGDGIPLLGPQVAVRGARSRLRITGPAGHNKGHGQLVTG
jgi:nucleoside-diphosphate-sugar epimerase